VMAPAEMFWGDRYGVVDDPFGHRWSLATHTREMTQEEIEVGMKAASCGQMGT
ncbi:MAG: VOC family protein, partial [Comamonadaceae bacterium]